MLARQDVRVADREREASWARTTTNLEAAIQSLPQSTGSGVDDVEHYLQANELGLAFDVLAEVGAEQRTKRAFWKYLKRAADEMKLEVGAVPHGESYADVEARLNRPDLCPCPSCGHLVFDEEPGSYSICPVCGWEDDLSQLRFVTTGGANPPFHRVPEIPYPRHPTVGRHGLRTRSSMAPARHGTRPDRVAHI